MFVRAAVCVCSGAVLLSAISGLEPDASFWAGGASIILVLVDSLVPRKYTVE